MHRCAQQQAKRIDENVALAIRDLLEGRARPPFCAPLVLWLSIIAVVGLASRVPQD
jgi:hypothetical protein